jgi:kinetochore protein Spc7/SPC105
MTDIRFMDEITAPRRSVHPASRPAPRESSTIPLAEYVIAHDVDIPQMKLYSHISKDFQKWIEKSKEYYKEAEEEVQKITPKLFEEFQDTDEEGKAELLVCVLSISGNSC